MLFAGALALTAAGAAYALPQGAERSYGAGPAALTGPCTATATINETGVGINPSASDEFTAPIKGSATYQGSVSVPAEERPIAGEVSVTMPPGFPGIKIKQWQDDTATNVSDSGTVTWDLPAALPRGITVTAQGYHIDGSARCDGWMRVKLEGGITDSPAGVASLALTIIFAAGIGFSAVPRGR